MMKNIRIFLSIASTALVFSAMIPLPQAPLKIKVQAASAWTDTGLDVKDGDEIFLTAEGTISLQKGNPEAFCGPQGLDLQTLQQPLPDKNLGCLIGKVVKLVSIEIDEKTKKEIRNEMMQMFFVGKENRVKITLNGRLYLGINEAVVQDNSGEFQATLTFEIKK